MLNLAVYEKELKQVEIELLKTKHKVRFLERQRELLNNLVPIARKEEREQFKQSELLKERLSRV